MSEVKIKPVETRREKRQFIDLPWMIYQNDPNWIPPLRRNVQELVGFRRHPFHDFATVRNWLAFCDGQPVGRISGILNPTHNAKYNEQRGFFGFFESVDDQQVANGLFDAVREWFEPQGIADLRGPVNPSLNYEVGLLIEGFDSPPTFMMTYNPPYYARLIEHYGFGKAQDLFAFWGHIDMISTLDKKLAFIVNEATRRFDIRLRILDRKRFREEVQTFLHIYNASLEGTWGFTPLSAGEIDHMSAALRHLVVPELTAVAEVGGRPVGAVFGLLDYNPRIKQINGRLFPFGFVRLLSRRKRISTIRLISTNVLPEYQRWGVGVVALARLLPDAIEWGIQDAEFSWVLESNHLSYKSLKRGGAKLTKSYRVYDYPPSENQS
jgi:GNAT superfamily N-acetyltransferase